MPDYFEKTLVAACCEVAQAMGAHLEVIGQRNARGSGTTVGAPDALLVCCGQVRLIEFKTADGRLSLAQKSRIYERAEQHVDTDVVRSVNEFVALVNSCRRQPVAPL